MVSNLNEKVAFARLVGEAHQNMFSERLHLSVSLSVRLAAFSGSDEKSIFVDGSPTLKFWPTGSEVWQLRWHRSFNGKFTSDSRSSPVVWTTFRYSGVAVNISRFTRLLSIDIQYKRCVPSTLHSVVAAEVKIYLRLDSTLSYRRKNVLRISKVDPTYNFSWNTYKLSRNPLRSLRLRGTSCDECWKSSHFNAVRESVTTDLSESVRGSIRQFCHLIHPLLSDQEVDSWR